MKRGDLAPIGLKFGRRDQGRKRAGPIPQNLGRATKRLGAASDFPVLALFSSKGPHLSISSEGFGSRGFILAWGVVQGRDMLPSYFGLDILCDGGESGGQRGRILEGKTGFSHAIRKPACRFSSTLLSEVYSIRRRMF